MKLNDVSKYLSLILRHKPEIIGIELDKNGWGRVDEILSNLPTEYKIDFNTLEEIVKADNKQRYSFNEDKTKIRANQGHSIKVDVELKEVVPPDVLYHGTAEKYVDSIKKQGLVSKQRLHVHLSDNIDTAVLVGSRHGNPFVFSLDAKQMYEDCYKFYKSENGVYLTNDVPSKYLSEHVLQKPLKKSCLIETSSDFHEIDVLNQLNDINKKYANTMYFEKVEQSPELLDYDGLDF